MISAMRTLAMARKEVLQLRRDTRSLLLAFMLPLFLLLVFGAAISLDVRHIPFAVLDRDRSAASRELVEAFSASGYFDAQAPVGDDAEVARLLRRTAVRMVLVIPPGFARDLAAGRQPEVQALLDGSDANTATIALNYADAIIAGLGARTAASASGLPITPAARVWYNETLESARAVVPGLVGVIMAMVSAMLTALTIAREWERGTMEQLASTPVGRFEVILGKMLPYVGIGIIDVVMVVLVGVGVFDVPLRGSIPLLAALSLLFILGMLGFGILLSATMPSQLFATQVALLATYLPTFLLSGFLYPIANMPAVLQGLSWLIPARYYLEVTRGIFLKGVGLEVLWPEALALLVNATVMVLLAVRAFRKEVR